MIEDPNTVDTRLIDMLLRYEQLREQGQSVTLRELCRDYPELLEEAQRLLDKFEILSPPCLPTNDAETTLGDSRPLIVPPPTIPGYEILSELGRGGMGIVYQARDLNLKRLVALKTILAGSLAGAEDIKRFHIEAEAIARLQHPNIVQIFDVGSQEAMAYFSLELVDGGTLASLLRANPPTPELAVSLTATLARAIHHAHQRGIVHRDLKPANVLMMADGTPKITDFGLAKQLNDDSGQTRTGAVMGTPSYMAPEQAAGQIQAIGPLTDVYSLGVILYELLIGHPPFRGQNVIETLDLVRTQEPTAPSTIRRGIPRDLETICLKAMAKDPLQRYASALALADDLDRFSAGEPVLARRQGIMTKAWRKLRRNTAKAVMALGVLAIVALAVVVALSARSASQAAALQNEIGAALDEDTLQGTEEYITELETKIAKLERIDPVQSEAATIKLWERLGQWVQKEIRLAPDAAETKERLQPTIGRIAVKNSELAEGLRKQLEDRLDRWDPIFQMTEPFAQVDKFLPIGQFRIDAKSLQIIPPSKPVIPRLVLTNQDSPRNSEARVVFGYPSWKDVGELGLAFSASKKSGYTFVLRIGGAKDASKPLPIDAARETGADVYLQIRRNGALLVQQKIPAQALGVSPVEIWAKREGMQLTCRLNQFKPLEFVDPFPLGAGEPGVFGLVVRSPVALTLFAAYRKSLAVKPRPLDQGDALYEANQFEDAIQHYRNQAGLVTEPELIQQARYKEALCLVESKRESEAIGLLKDISNGAGNRWPVLAECQLYLLLARHKDAVSRTEASMILDRLLGRDHGQQSLVTLLPDEIRSALRELDPSYFELFIATNQEKAHYVRASKQRLALEKLLEADPGVLMHGENLLLMAYRLVGMEMEAETFTRRRMGERGPIATSMLTHFFWILRTSGRAKEALSLLDFWKSKQPDDGLLLERARINVELKNWTDAEQDLNVILQAKSPNAVKVVEALCMKGFLRERAGDLKGAQDAWKKGIEIYHTVKRRPGDPFDQNVMRLMNYWIMVSMSGEMSDEDCRGIQQFLLAGNRGDGQTQQIAEVASSLIPAAVIRETWRTPRGRELARKWVYRQSSYAETGLMPFYLLGAETLHQFAVPGPLSPEHDQLIWDLVQNGSRAYFEDKLGKEQILTIGLTFKASPWFWAGVEKSLDPSVGGPTAYLLGHRYLGRDAKQAATFFQSALSSAPPGSVLQRLAQSQLDKLKKAKS